MKILIKENTRIDGEHLGVNKEYDVSQEHGEFLVMLGRAVRVKEEVKKEEILTKNENLAEVNNREQELKVSKRKTKSKE